MSKCCCCPPDYSTAAAASAAAAAVSAVAAAASAAEAAASAGTDCEAVTVCIEDSFCWTSITTEEELTAFNLAAVGGAIIAAPITLTASIAINVPIQIPPCGGFTPGGNTLTINQSFEAGLYQVFTSGVNQITFGLHSTQQIYPEWFGATGDGVTDDTNALQGAINAGATYYIPIKFKGAKVYQTSGLTISDRSTLICDNYWNTGSRIRGTAANPLLTFPVGGTYIKLKGLILDGANLSTSLIEQNLSSYSEIEDCIFLNSTIGLDHSGGGIVNNFLRCKWTGTMATCAVKISGISNHLLFESCRFQISAGAATHDILTDTSWEGDMLIVRNCTFESEATLTDSIKLMHPVNVPGMQFIIEGNRFDGAKVNSLVNVTQYGMGTIRNNSFAGTCATPIACDGDYVMIDANYVTNSTVAGISFGANSNYCRMGAQMWGGIAPLVSDIGTRNEIHYRVEMGPFAFSNKEWKGTTANRPTMAAGKFSTTPFLDTTLDADGKPIWWNGAAWIDALGNIV